MKSLSKLLIIFIVIAGCSTPDPEGFEPSRPRYQYIYLPTDKDCDPNVTRVIYPYYSYLIIECEKGFSLRPEKGGKVQ